MRLILGMILSFAPVVAGAQTMYKCLDSQRRVTYSNVSCEKQGLSDAGPVADRVTSMPFTAPPKPAAAAPAKPPAEAAEPADGTQPKPVTPPLEKLSK
jgi:hypothetical protein